MESNHTGAESKSDGAGPAVMAHDRSDADTHTDPTREASAVCPPDGDTSSSSEESSDSSSESDDEETADSTAGAAPVDDKICCICKVEPRYRCPGCSRRTCSLGCCREHKTRFDCNGKRARSQYAPTIRHMNDDTILEDYYLMEDASRFVGGSNRCGRAEKRVRGSKQLPFKLKKLVQAVDKHNGKLLIMPDEFERHKANKSHYDDRRGRILWTVRWLFPAAQAQYLVHRVPDDKPVSELLAEFVTIGPDTVVRRNRLKPYLKPGSTVLDHLRISVGAERTAPGEPATRECPHDKCLRDVIDGLTLIEFPVLTVEIR